MSSKKKTAKAEQFVADTSAQVQKLAKKAQKEAEKYIESARKLVEKAEASYKEILAKLAQVIKTGDSDAKTIV
jgi:cell division septum initiation protein DivIVA